MLFVRSRNINKSHSTLCSMSSKSRVSSSCDSNNNDDDDGADSGQCNGNATESESTSSDRRANDRRHSEKSTGDDIVDDSSSDLSYNECDITLIDDEEMCDAKNEAELMFFQVVETLRSEEVCFWLFFFLLLSVQCSVIGIRCLSTVVWHYRLGVIRNMKCEKCKIS